MKKIIPLRQQVTRSVLDNPHLDNGYIVSGCLCHHYMSDRLKECDKCLIRFYCYTSFKITRETLDSIEYKSALKDNFQSVYGNKT